MDDIETKDQFMEALIYDARREFVGEGQTLFIYKRLNQVLPSFDNGDITPIEANFVLPKPAYESNIK